MSCVHRVTGWGPDFRLTPPGGPGPCGPVQRVVPRVVPVVEVNLVSSRLVVTSGPFAPFSPGPTSCRSELVLHENRVCGQIFKVGADGGGADLKVYFYRTGSD